MGEAGVLMLNNGRCDDKMCLLGNLKYLIL